VLDLMALIQFLITEPCVFGLTELVQ